jgi:hypothetical protein
MKNLLLCFALILISTNLINCNEKITDYKNTDWVKDGLKGEVEKFTQVVYVIRKNNGESVKEQSGKTVCSYNGRGVRTMVTEYNRDNMYNSKYVYKYNNAGKASGWDYYLGTSVYFKRMYIYNDKGILTESSDCKINTTGDDCIISSKSIYKYDSAQNLIETTLFDNNGSINQKISSSYDEKGNKITESEFGSKSKILNKYINEYDAKSNIIKSSCYNANGILKSVILYKYDDKGFILTEEHFNAEKNLVEKAMFKNDSKGNKTQSVRYNSAGDVILEIECEYSYY